MYRFLITLSAAALLIVSCADKTETIKALQDAANAETLAVDQYTAFAQQALKDTLPKTAAMFSAVAASEAVHLKNHLEELKKLGAKFEPEIGNVMLESTIGNLYVAKNGEEYEVQSMYPDMIASADKEQARSAQKSFERAMAIEEKHAALFISAIESLQNNGNEDSLTVGYVLCPICGDIYLSGTQPDKCEICGAKAKKFQNL